METVETRPVRGNLRYRVTKDGRIRGKYSHTVDGKRAKWLKGTKHPNGHTMITIYADGERNTYDLGRLVIEAWCPVDHKGLELCYKNGDFSDTRLENLCWLTHKAILARSKKPARQCKLTHEDMALIRDMYATGEFTQAELAKGYEVSRPYISRIVNNNV